MQRGIDLQLLEVDVGLHEPVEQHESVGAGGDESVRHVSHAAKNGPIFTASGIVISARTASTSFT